MALSGPIGGDAATHLGGVGDVFASFLDQDSGCQAFGVVVDGARWFVKVPVEARALPLLHGQEERRGAVRGEVSLKRLVHLPGAGAGR